MRVKGRNDYPITRTDEALISKGIPARTANPLSGWPVGDFTVEACSGDPKCHSTVTRKCNGIKCFNEFNVFSGFHKPRLVLRTAAASESVSHPALQSSKRPSLIPTPLNPLQPRTVRALQQYITLDHQRQHTVRFDEET